MSDQLKSHFLITFQQMVPPSQHKVMDKAFSRIATAVEHGERTLDPAETFQMANGVTDIYFMSEEPISFTCDSDFLMDKVSQFAYSSPMKKTFSVTNTSAVPVKIWFAAGVTLQ